jgi:hypothetical protein
MAWVDGPKADFSASLIRRSSSAMKSRPALASLGATRWLTSATAILPASTPTLSSRNS